MANDCERFKLSFLLSKLELNSLKQMKYIILVQNIMAQWKINIDKRSGQDTELEYECDSLFGILLSAAKPINQGSAQPRRQRTLASARNGANPSLNHHYLAN